MEEDVRSQRNSLFALAAIMIWALSRFMPIILFRAFPGKLSMLYSYAPLMGIGLYAMAIIGLILGMTSLFRFEQRRALAIAAIILNVLAMMPRGIKEFVFQFALLL